jgi:hypothetical protein
VGQTGTLHRKRVFVGGFALAACAALLVGLATAVGAYPPALSAAAGAFETALGPGGSGFRFEVAQRQTEDQKPGGSPIPVLDASNPSSIIGTTDHAYVNSVLARGQVTAGAFWMEMRYGPTTELAPANFDTAPFVFAVIYQPPNLWRNDGFGWYRADVSPGVGMDPTTAVKLPLAVRSLKTISDLGMTTLGGVAVHHYAAMVEVANFPGVVASDGAAFTETPFPIDLWLDSSNRLVQLEARARNLNETNFLLKIDTVITFSYVAAGPVPAPAPTAGPSAHPLP